MDSALILLVAGALVAGFVQGLSGFAFGLTAMSFWAWVLEPRLAAVLVVFGSIFGQLIAVFSVRRALSLASLAPYLAGGLLGLPVGIAVLPLVDAQAFRLVIGLVLVVWCPLMLLSDRLPKLESRSRVADAIVGLSGGVMSGLGGFSGVTTTLWCTLRQLPKDEARTIVQNFNLAILSATVAGYVATGTVRLADLPSLAVVGGAMTVPVLLGARVYSGLSPAAFRRIVLTLLSLSGLAMVVSSLPAFLRH